METEEPVVVKPFCPRCKNLIPESELTKPVINCAYCRLIFNNPVFEFVEEGEVAKIPDIAVRWVRGQEWIKFTRPNLYLVLGARGAGKSSLLEVLAIRYPKIIDMLEANDGESLCWCKPQFAKVWKAIHGSEPRILLLTGQTKKVICKWDTLIVTELRLDTFEEYDIIILCHKFFADEPDYFDALFTIIHLLWEERTYWTEPYFLLIREAANWIYARLKTVKDDKMAKAEFVKQLNEARHKGLACGVDTIRFTNIDKAARDLAEYTFIKKPGRPNLPDELRWIWRYFGVFIRKMKKDRFVLITQDENIGIGKFDGSSWHKEERENIFKDLEISVVDRETGEVSSNERTTKYSSPDLAHAKLIEAYKVGGSVYKAEEITGKNHQTVLNHVNVHNEAVRRYGICKKCEKAECAFAKEILTKDKRGSSLKNNM